MPKLSSIEELAEFRALLRYDGDDTKPRLVLCAGTACQASGANGIIRVVKRHIMEKQLHERVSLSITGCHGFCEMGPFVLVEPLGAFYSQVKLDDVPRIIEATLSGDYVEDLLYRDPKTGHMYYHREDIPFFKNQQRTLLKMNSRVDPIRIYDYIARDGYMALEKTLSGGNPKRVIDEVKRSGLRGRGGAGFPTGVKWELLSAQPGLEGKFLVCNADEGDPGAYMDRSLLEGNPHSIIEGMIIAAYATGATQGIVYVRNEYPLAIKHLIIALRQARDHGLLGGHILGSEFSFDIDIVKGAGAFVCGEETALVRSIEGTVGEPRQRPPFPVQRGINGKPTAINNVETWANIPTIIRCGADEYAKTGTEGNSGTKIFSLVGKIKNTGLVEVPMGTKISEIVYGIGGGPPGPAKIKAVQTGGPSGGCIPADKFDLPIDYDSLAEAGSIMGSGGMIVMDENTCMVDVAKYFMKFLKDESCGKCFTCRKGTQRMYEILEDISTGKGTLEQLDLLEELAEAVKDTTMCGLGQTASNPVLSTLLYFRHEYVRHIVDKQCDSFVCRDLVGAPCQSACPLGTEAWRYVAHIERGEYEEAYKVIREANPFPSVCARVCDHMCESRCRLGTSGGEPVAIRALKRFITDHVDPAAHEPLREVGAGKRQAKIAVVGAGPSGLTAAHNLSLLGYEVTLYEGENEIGGMLVSCIPAYRLPRDVVRREMESLIDENITLKCRTLLGSDITIDGLFEEGFKAVFLAMGAHRSLQLGFPGEDSEGIHPSMRFLKAFNLSGQELARGRVGVIGGGNSAVDAARVAIRQKDVESVTMIYRRTREEMPAYEEEIKAALEEGVNLEILVTPLNIHTAKDALTGIRCVKNELGDIDSSGRPRPVPMPGTEFDLPLDTLIIAIGERPESDYLASTGLDIGKNGNLNAHKGTLRTGRDGVFGGGDLVTGSNTVVAAIAAGKKAAAAIDAYLRGEEMRQPSRVRLPEVFLEPSAATDEGSGEAGRVKLPELDVASRTIGFAEVDMAMSADQARCEARRCMRCDLEFTQPKDAEATLQAAEGSST